MFNLTELQLIEKTLTGKRDWLHKNILATNNPELFLQNLKNQETCDEIDVLLSKINIHLNAHASTMFNPALIDNEPYLAAKYKRQIMSPQCIKTLVVDDDVIMLSLIEMILQSAGIEKIHTAEDGEKAISMLYEATIPYDLVLCDMNMPLKNGLDVHKAIRTSERYADTFFMLVTAVSEAREIDAAINSGVNDYAVKPIEKNTLLKKIARHFPNIHIDKQADEST